VNNKAILEIRELKKYFPTKRKDVYIKAVDGISFDIEPSDTFGLVGESGSGKSTTAYCTIGMYSISSGRITYTGKDISVPAKKRPLSLKKEIQIVFQDPGTSLNPEHTVGRIVSLPLKIHMNLKGAALRDAAIDVLDKVELPSDYYYKYPWEIGGGEKQLVAIARALAAKPSLVILDEPTSALDVSVQAKIISTLQKLKEDLSLSFLFITHDLSLMRNIATRIAIMYLGKIVEVGPVEALFSNPLHPYTKMLLSSIPVVTEAEELLKPKQIESKGEIPSPVNIPPGCGFQSRCPLVKSVCKEIDPPIRAISEDHMVKCHLFEGAIENYGSERSDSCPKKYKKLH
jgi:peptide/nickel transport system ATP-binding protein